jgi:RNA polymerase sigma factor (sigma-70 family)
MMNKFNTRQPISHFASSPMTLQEIADAMNLSKERIRQIEAKAIRKLRQRMVESKINPKDVLNN